MNNARCVVHEEAHLGGVARIAFIQLEAKTHFVVALAVRIAILLNGEAVVEEEAAVALLPVAIVHLLVLLQCLQGGDRELVHRLVERPACLTRPQVVQHIGVGHKRIGLHAVNLHTEVTACNHHACPHKLLQRKLFELRSRLCSTGHEQRTDERRTKEQPLAGEQTRTRMISSRSALMLILRSFTCCKM